MFRRYAVYYTPEGGLAEAGAAWLGWDLAKGVRVGHPEIAGLDAPALTATPRRYGLHGTVKPPFFLADGATAEELEASLANLCTSLGPVTLQGLDLMAMSGFVALRPVGEKTELADMAAQVVTRLDGFRAPPSDDELARRRKSARLTSVQERHLVQWGYPYVMDQFRFHITLTGRSIEADAIAKRLKPYFLPYLPVPLRIDSLTLVGQDQSGMFHEIHRYALTG